MGDESKSREELLAELLFGYSAEDVTAGVAGLALFTEPDAARAAASSAPRPSPRHQRPQGHGAPP